MTAKQALAFLDYPDADLVAYAIKRANLTDAELEILHLRRNKTIEEAAEMLAVSPTTVKTRHSNALRKLTACWSALPWIMTSLL